ncbi:proto-oncogene vav-like, partial [Saccostrea cucullata]|uniref:proto-oncogene vav-like n=1 Tax=Saccostrea cuccullata TaxID=36930 RepID=UPI002ED24BFC
DHSFIMAKKDGSNAFTFFAKTEDTRAKWIDAIKLALECFPSQGINYVMHTFDKPTECSVCHKLLRGVFFQGYKCTDPGSDIAVHKECIGKPPNTGSRGKILIFMGGLLNGDEGWFPSQLVQEENNPRVRCHVLSSLYMLIGLLYMNVIYMFVTSSLLSSIPKTPYLDVKMKNGTPSIVVDSDGMSSQLNVYKWYVCGSNGQDTANRRLGNMPNGTFLIRVSENPGRRGETPLYCRYDNQVRHIRVEKNAEGLFYLADTKFFSSLPELVEFYQDNSLADGFSRGGKNQKFPFKSQAGGGEKSRKELLCKGFGLRKAVYD